MDISIDQIRDIVTNWAESHREIERVFLFGSRARRDSTESSDVDLAIVVEGSEGESAYARYGFNRDDWKEELESALGLSISLVRRVDHGRREIQAGIDRDGELLYERPSE